MLAGFQRAHQHLTSAPPLGNSRPAIGGQDLVHLCVFSQETPPPRNLYAFFIGRQVSISIDLWGQWHRTLNPAVWVSEGTKQHKDTKTKEDSAILQPLFTKS